MSEKNNQLENKVCSKNTIQINVITEKTKKSFKTRLITSAFIAATCIPAVILGYWFFAIFICLVSIVGTWEFIKV